MKKSLLPRAVKDKDAQSVVIEELSGQEIAIIGMALKVPGADSLDQFWSNLCRGEDWIREAPPARMTADGLRPSQTKPPRGGYLSEIDTFDSLFFGIPPKEADLMDPYQRLFLETAWCTIEDAGYGGDRLKGSRTGVYIGSGHEHEYKQMLTNVNPELLSAGAAGNLPPVIASRICYLLDLKGPSLVVDTACSSSLMAVHLACQALTLRECDMAIAGGIQLMLDPNAHRPKIGIESPSSMVRAFDEDADGTVRGEGMGAVLLKPLSRAVADNDRVYAVIKGSVSNQDGKSIGITAPNRAAQEQLLIDAWEKASIHPSTLSFIETHGTGTPIGDPIEIHAIQNAFRAYTDKVQFCAIGSIKPNIGHLYHAAGIISLIKSSLALHYEQIPPSIHFERPNSRIDFVQSPVYVNTTLAEWKRGEEVRRCGVSSFGMSGTNCHVILEETGTGKMALQSPLAEVEPAMLTLSAKSLSSLRALLEKYRVYLLTADPLSFRDICYTTNIGRGCYEYRLAVIARDQKELRDKLADLRYESFSGACSELTEGIWFGGPETEQLNISLPSQSGKDIWEEAAIRYVRGLKVDWSAMHAGRMRRIVSVPTYAFDKHKHWIARPTGDQNNAAVDNKSDNVGGGQEVKAIDTQAKYIQTVTEMLRGMIADISGYRPEEIGIKRSFMEMGMDSILLVNVRNAIKQRFGTDIPIRLFFENMSTVADIGQYIASQSVDLSASGVISDPMENTAKDEAATAFAVYDPADIEAPGEFGSTTGVNLESIVHKQLDLMSKQISMLQNSSRVMPDAPPVHLHNTFAKNGRMETNAIHNRAADRRETFAPVQARSQDRPYVPYQKIETAAKSGFTPSQQRFIDEFIVRYTEKTRKSQHHTQTYRNVVANNRNVAGFRPYWKDIVYQIVVDRAEGSNIIDIDGNKYIDLTMGFGVNLFGHHTSFIHQAVDEALKKGMSIGPINAVAGQVATVLRSLTGMERAAFFNSGTEAVMVAVRLARAATGKSKIAVFSGSYHGTYDGVLAMAAGSDGASSPIAPGIPHGMIDEVIILNYDHPESLRIIENNAGELAAVLVEPVQSRKPDVQPAEFLQKLRALTAGHGIALIFDEVITGFRIHPGGAQAWFNIEADIAVYGKVVGGGLPIGIVAGKPYYLDGIDGGMWSFGDTSIPPNEERRTFVAGTFCQHPLAMNAALAVLNRLQAEGPALQEELNRKTAILADSLNRYFEEEQLPLHIVRFGSLFRFVQKTDLELLYYLLIEKGIYIWEGRNCFLSTAHTLEDIETIVVAVKSSIEELRNAGFLLPAPTPPRGNGKKKSEQSADQTSTGTFSLTEEQKQMWFASQANPDTSAAYMESTILRLQGSIDTDRLQAAINYVIHRHGMLRAHFAEDGSDYRIDPFDSTDSRYKLYEAKVDGTAACLPIPLLPEVVDGFDMTNGPLIKFGLLHAGEENHLFVLQAHHIAADGWSLIRILEEIAGYYTEPERFRAPDPVSFSAFAEWQSSLPTEEIQRARGFWSDKLSDPVPELVFPAASGLGFGSPQSGVRLRRTVNSTITAKLRAYGMNSGNSLFMLMLAAYNMLLTRLSGIREITVGIPVSGQLQMGASHLVGQCVNLLPFTSKLPSSVNFTEYVVQMKSELLDLLEHQRCSYADIVTTLGKEGNHVFPPSIRTVFNFDKPPKLWFGDLETKIETGQATAFKYPLSLNVLELEQELILEWDVGKGVCGTEEAETWLEAYCLLLEDIVSIGKKELRLDSIQRVQTPQLLSLIDSKEEQLADSGTGFVADEEGYPSLPGVPGRIYWSSEAEAGRAQPTDMAAVAGADGNLRLLGHMDRLVCIGGFRVHLDQIEAVLSRGCERPEIAITLESDTRSRESLVVYCVSGGEHEPNEHNWREHVSAILPGSLVPVKWINVPEDLPRNEQGVDYDLLTARYGRVSAPSAVPVTELQKQIHQVWCEALKQGEIGIHDLFFEVGGNSLVATIIAARLQGELGKKVPLSLLFHRPTIAELAEVLDSSSSAWAETVKIPQAETAEFYPQSASQRAIFAIERLGGAGTAYNVTGLITVEGFLDLDRMKQAANELVRRHECLRTSFHLEDDEPVQKVIREVNFDVPVHTLDSSEDEATILSSVRPYDLERAPLFRIEVWREQAEGGRQYILMDMHHMIADGLSANLLLDELIRLYDGQSLPDIALHLKDFTQWQLGRIGAGYMRESEKYWSRLLKGSSPRLDWTTDYPRPLVRSLEGDRYGFRLEQKTLTRIREFASARGITVYSYLLTAFNILLSKYAGQEDIILGTTVSGRLYPDVERIPGMFANTIPLRNKVNSDGRFSELVHDIQTNSLEAFEHQEYPLERLNAFAEPDRDPSRNPMFDVVYIYQHEALKPEPKIGGNAKFTAAECKSKIAKFDLTLEAIESSDEINLYWEYCTALFHPEFIQAMANHLITILETVAATPDIRVSEIGLLAPEEREQLLHQFNDTAAHYPADKPVFILFEEQTRRSPDAVAISFEGQQFTYAELNARANRWAALLREKGVRSEAAVGLVMRRSPDLIATMLGIWKAGGCYVPIDPSYPKERIGYILSDSNAHWVITDTAYEELSGYTGNLILVTEAFYSEDLPLPSSNPEPAAGPDNLAYIMYTSGSTGKPKGVMVEHKGLTHYICWADRMYVRGDSISFPLYSSISFDLTVTSMFTPLISGNRIIIYPDNVDAALERIIGDGEADIIKLTPSHLKLLSLYNTSRSRLRRFIVGGEALETSAAAEIMQLFGPETEIYNEYGPTETVVGCMIHKYEPGETRSQVPIGLPIDNIRLYVTDHLGRLQAKFLPGELCIAGAGVARGYLNHAELTQQKFVSGWFDEPGQVYKTGDLVRWLPGGGMEYLGRIDEQIKIRGYRIETGEIQHLLLEYPSIREAAVLAKDNEDGARRLCAFYASEEELEAQRLEAYLSNHLPAYMLPAEFIWLNRLPLSANGKVDYKKLRDMDSQQKHENEPLLPKDPVEAELLEVWQDILKAPNANGNESFIKAGGDSIKAIQIAAHMKKRGYHLEAADILRGQTVRKISALAVQISEKSVKNASAPMEGEVPLAPIQRWFFERNFTEMNHWNQCVTIIGTVRFNENLVKQTIKELIRHHDALRMTYARSADGIRQWCQKEDQAVFTFRFVDGTLAENLMSVRERVVQEMYLDIDLENGPLLQVGLIRGENEDELTLVIHHLVIDAVSWRILLDDFYDIYSAFRQGMKPKLPDKSDSYKDYSQLMQDYADKGLWERELDYWNAMSALPASFIPKDMEAGNGKLRDAAVSSLHLTREFTASLLKAAVERCYGDTVAMLLASLGHAIHGLGISDGIWVNMEGHGRETFGSHFDYSRTVGWFTSHYPVYLDLAAAKHPGSYGALLHQEMQRIPHRGAGYNALKYMLPNDDVARIEALWIHPEICFNYVGEMEDNRYHALFRLADLPMHGTESPDSERPFSIACNVLLSNGRIIIELEYNKREYKEETIQRLLQGFLIGLEKILSVSGELVVLEKGIGDFHLDPVVEQTILQSETPYQISKVYPLSPMQESMLFHYLRFPDSDAYLEQFVIHFKGSIDPERLRNSFQQVTDRHDILRTFFAVQGLERPLQAVAKTWTLPFKYEDWMNTEDASDKNKLSSYLIEDRENRFDLFGEVPLRVSLIRTGDEDYCLAWSFHHILLDGWSVGLLLSELFGRYAEQGLQRTPGTAPLYAEYINWLERKDPSAAEAYWQTYLSGYRSKSLLPREGGTSSVYSPGEVSRVLTEELRHGLMKLSADQSLTLNILMQAAWTTVLQKLNDTDDIMFGTVVSGRSPEVQDIDAMIGLFINTIPIRVKTSTVPFGELARQLQREMLDKESYAYLPLSSIQSLGGGATLDHILVFENYPLELKLPSELEMVDYDWHEYTNYDFNLIVEPHENFLIRFVYNRAVFSEEELEYWLDCLLTVLERIIDNPDVLPHEILLNEAIEVPDNDENHIEFHF